LGDIKPLAASIHIYEKVQSEQSEILVLVQLLPVYLPKLQFLDLIALVLKNQARLASLWKTCARSIYTTNDARFD
jgi:hypothetical protein